MKIHLPLALRGLLLSLQIPGTHLTADITDVPGIGYTNPSFDGPVTQDLHFTQYAWKGNYNDPDNESNGDRGTGWIRIELSECDLSLSGSPEATDKYDVTFSSLGEGNTIYTGRALHIADGSTFEASYLGTISFTSHLVRNAYSEQGGAISVKGKSTLHFHHNDTVLFEENVVYGSGGAISLNNGSLLMEENRYAIFRNNGAFGKESLAGSAQGGAISMVKSTLTIQNNGSVLFEGNANRPAGGAISTSTMNGGTCVLTFTGNDSVSFIKNTSESDGGAIHSEGSLTMNDNETILFSQNIASSCGGAISGGLILTNTKWDVTFQNNTAKASGGAIYGDKEVVITDNMVVHFTENQSGENFSGGAIHGTDVTLKNNFSLTFSSNTAGKNGGAIDLSKGTYSYRYFHMTGNETVHFSENTATEQGGALYLYNCGEVDIDSNEDIDFSRNTAGTNGGAVSSNHNGYGTGLHFTNNKNVTFQDNSTGVNGGAVYSQKELLFSGNGMLNFEGNRANGQGGAIYANSSLTIADNDTVFFEANHILRTNDEGTVVGAVLNGIYARGDVVLSTKAEDDDGFNDIFFDDPLISTNTSSTTILNSFTKDDGTVVKGSGRIVFVSWSAKENLTGIFQMNGLEASGDIFEECLAESKVSRFGNDVVLAGGSLEAWGGATVTMKSYTARSGSETLLADECSLEIAGNAAFEAGSVFRTNTRSEPANTLNATANSLTAASVSMTGATLDCLTSSSVQSLTIHSPEVTLTDATVILRAEMNENVYTYGSNNVLVDGNLTISGTTRVLFAQGNREAHFQLPEGNTVLFVYKTMNADLATDKWEFAAMKNLDGTHVCQTVAGNLLEIQFDGEHKALAFLSSSTPPVEPDDSTIVSSGDEKVITDLSENISLQGGTLDASGVDAETPLTNAVIKGTDGILKMNEEQTMQLSGTDTLGYNIEGADPGAVSGSMHVGASKGTLSDAAITLAGQAYLVKELAVQSGLAIVAKNTAVGNTGTTAINIGSSAEGNSLAAVLKNDGDLFAHTVGITANASLTNNKDLRSDAIEVAGKGVLGNAGTIETEAAHVLAGGSLNNEGIIQSVPDSEKAAVITVAGSMVNTGTVEGNIEVQDGGSLKGSGAFTAVAVASGGYLMAGNSPGAPVYENLTLTEGATMAFAVDGPKPATKTASGNGTHSFATVSDTLTIDGTPNVEVTVGSGIVAAGSDTFTLTLLQAAQVAGSGSFDPLAMTLTGETGLLEEGASIAWDAETGTLTFTGKVNQSAAGSLSGGDAARLADTLWSSTTAVASFGRRAMEQGRTMEAGKGRFWASGFGNFTSMSQEGSLGGFNYNGGGYAVGGDVAVSDKLVLGASLGQEFGTHKTDDALLSDKQRSLMFALYGNYREQLAKGDSLDLSGYFAYGSIDHTAHTHIGGSQATPGRATWDDDAYAFGLLANWNIQTSKTVTVSPFTGLTYMRGSQGGITETFDGGSRRFEDGSMQVWSLPVGLTVKSACAAGNGQVVTPELTVAYVGDIARQNPRVRTQSAGNAVSGRGHAPGRSAVMARAGLGWKISNALSTGAWYTIEARSGQTNQSVNLNVTYTF